MKGKMNGTQNDSKLFLYSAVSTKVVHKCIHRGYTPPVLIPKYLYIGGIYIYH